MLLGTSGNFNCANLRQIKENSTLVCKIKFSSTKGVKALPTCMNWMGILLLFLLDGQKKRTNLKKFILNFIKIDKCSLLSCVSFFSIFNCRNFFRCNFSFVSFLSFRTTTAFSFFNFFFTTCVKFVEVN